MPEQLLVVLDNTSGNLIIKSGTTTALTFSGANVTAAGTITGNLTGNVTGNASGTALTVTQAAQSAITSLELDCIDCR